MKVHLYSVYDKAVIAFMPPFQVRARGEAVRSFIDACNDAKVPFGKNAGDYDLYYIGTFDDATGKYENGENCPLQVMSARDAVQSVEVDQTISPDFPVRGAA